MTDYIRRDDLMEVRNRAICAYENANVFNANAIRGNLKPLLDAVVDVPAADVVEVIHAHWIMHDDDFGLTCECSHCHIETMGDSEYCLHCGARMDGDTVYEK